MIGSGRSGDTRIKDAALQWLLRLSLDNPGSAERARFEAWRAQDPSHDDAYRRFAGIWQDCARLEELAHLAPLADRAGTERAASSPITPKQLAWASALAAAACAAVLLSPQLFSSLWASRSAGYSTEVKEIRELSLADGSRVTLGARSSIAVDLTATQRRVMLHGGEAFFAVAKDPVRPFVVEAGDQQVRALGTQFEVRRGSSGLSVAVVEGAVEVSGRPSAAGVGQSRQVLTAGQQVLVSSQQALTTPARIKTVDTEAVAAWRTGRLSYVDMPLGEIAADVTRYSNKHIEIKDDAVAQLKVSVSCGIDQVNETIENLVRALPVTVKHVTADRVVIEGVDSSGSSVSTP